MTNTGMFVITLTGPFPATDTLFLPAPRRLFVPRCAAVRLSLLPQAGMINV
ncbi:hypothetical protein [Erwinia billingiae]|uniref:hypothetical protein n=1 Tax=Erwinia billingiae TaxID=182337 RepID=UPI00320B20CF